MFGKKYGFHECEEVDSLVELVERSERLYSDSIAIKYKFKRQRREKTYRDLVRDSKTLGQYLLKAGLKTGHVALLGASSYEWITAYIGTMYAGMVIIPLDKELNAESLGEEILQSDADILLYDMEYAEVAQNILSLTNGNIKSACINDPDCPPVPEGEAVDFPKVDPEKLSAIVFTSGTTGKSKGVMLTQKNIASNVVDGVSAIDLEHGKDVAMSVLPMNHTFECTFTVFGGIYLGVTVCISGGLKYIQRELGEYQPTVMLVVPMIAQKLLDKVWYTAQKQGKADKLKKGIALCRLARAFGLDLTDKILGEVRAAFGGKLRMLICGGAPMSEELLLQCRDLGVTLLQGYGLTECSPLLSLNFPNYHRPNSVGKVIKHCQAKSVDGEIWAKGLSVSSGYYKNPEETAKSFENGWFKTGDLGFIDGDNFIFITGRKKNLIILGNGKNVSAEEIEEHLYNLPYVSETVVSGNNDKICAEIYLDPDIPDITEEKVHGDIAGINGKLAHYKRISVVKFREKPFPKTSTRKIIRYKTDENIEQEKGNSAAVV